MFEQNTNWLKMLKAVLFLSLLSVAFAGDCSYSEIAKITTCHALSDSSGVGCVGQCKYYPNSWTPYWCEYAGSSCSARDYDTNNNIDYQYGSCPSNATLKFAGAILIGTVGAGLPNAAECRIPRMPVRIASGSRSSPDSPLS